MEDANDTMKMKVDLTECLYYLEMITGELETMTEHRLDEIGYGLVCLIHPSDENDLDEIDKELDEMKDHVQKKVDEFMKTLDEAVRTYKKAVADLRPLYKEHKR